MAFQPVIKEVIAESAGNRLSGALLLVALVPIVALLLAFRARCYAANTSG